MKKFLLRKRVISAILTAITSILLATYPEQSLRIMKFVCDHLLMFIELEKQTTQTE